MKKISTISLLLLINFSFANALDINDVQIKNNIFMNEQDQKIIEQGYIDSELLNHMNSKKGNSVNLSPAPIVGKVMKTNDTFLGKNSPMDTNTNSSSNSFNNDFEEDFEDF